MSIREAFEAGEYPYEELQKKIPFMDKKIVYRVISIINQSDDKTVTMVRVSEIVKDSMERLGMGNGGGLNGIAKRAGINSKDIVDYIQYIVVGETGKDVKTYDPDAGDVDKVRGDKISTSGTETNPEGATVYKVQKTKPQKIKEAIEYSVGDIVSTPLGNGEVVKELGKGKYSVRINKDDAEELNLHTRLFRFNTSDLGGVVESLSEEDMQEYMVTSVEPYKPDMYDAEEIVGGNGEVIDFDYDHSGDPEDPYDVFVTFKSSLPLSELRKVIRGTVTKRMNEKSNALKGKLGKRRFSIKLDK